LSGRQQGESHGIEKSKTSRKVAGKAGGAKDGPRDKAGPREKGARKHRAADIGRALRSVYDDTLRESVPDDFLDLLGKLS
jgi:hypothetical protein